MKIIRLSFVDGKGRLCLIDQAFNLDEDRPLAYTSVFCDYLQQNKSKRPAQMPRFTLTERETYGHA